MRDVWKREESDFSTWLEQNIDTLSDALGFNLSVLQREKPAGAFQVDLVAEDEAGQLVVIENQLGPTDHDHFGKLLTYLTNLEAKIAIRTLAQPSGSCESGMFCESSSGSSFSRGPRSAASRCTPAAHLQRNIGSAPEQVKPD